MPYRIITKTVESIDSIIYYQIDCIRNHADLRIFPVHVAIQDKLALLEIDISSKACISDYLTTNTFSRNEWICLLLSITETISKCIEYFLEPACFNLSLHSMFYSIEQDSLDLNNIYLVYFPVLPDINDVPHDDPLHSLCYEILQFISSLPANTSDNLFSDDEYDKIMRMSCSSLINDISCLKSLLKREIVTDRNLGNTLSDEPLSVNRKTKNKNEFRFSEYTASHVFVMPAIALAAEIILIFMSFIIYKQREYFTGRIIPIVLISVILLFCGILDLFLLYNKKSPLYLIHTQKSTENIHADSISDSIFTSKEEKTVLLGKSAETARIAMLCSGVPGTPEESMGLKAYILVDDFIVGRDSAKVDFKINSLSVGRVHARISRKENSFFIEDLGSKNGTFLDQKKLKKNDEYNMPDNCRIRFAEQEFYFVAN